MKYKQTLKSFLLAAIVLSLASVASGQVTLPVKVRDGGTGGTTAATARVNLNAAPFGTSIVHHANGTQTPYQAAADTDAARGTALLAAVAAATDLERVAVGPGTYDLDDDSLDLSGVGTKGVHLIGSIGTIIRSDIDQVTGPIVRAGNKSLVDNLTVYAPLTDGTYQVPFSCTGDCPDGATLRNCHLIGESDGIYFYSNGIPPFVLKLRVESCIIEAKFDAIAGAGNSGTLRCDVFNSQLNVVGPSATGLGRSRGIALVDGTINLHNTEINVANGGDTETTGARTFEGGSAVVNVHPGTKFTVTNDGMAAELDLHQDVDGSIVIFGGSGTNANGSFVTSGTISYRGPTVFTTAANAWADGVKQIFNPNGTAAGFNFGAHTADPSSLANADAWYDSTNNLLNFRINGGTVGLGYDGTSLKPNKPLDLGSQTLTAGTVNSQGVALNDLFDASHRLSLVNATNLDGNREIYFAGITASRTITISGNPTLNDWFDQSVKVAASPTFANVTVGAEAYDATGWNGDNTAPTKNDVRDKIEALSIGGFDPTAVVGSQTWGDGSTDTIVWTFNRSTGTDPTITFNSGSIGFQAITLGTALAASSGGTGLTALSANTVTFLGAADYAAMRTQLGLVIGTNVQAYDADLTTYAGITPSANVQSLLGAADYSAARTLLSLVPGTNVQAYDADLTTYAGITPSANIQTLLGSADYAAARTNLGLVIGTNVQAYDADLTTWAGITPSANIQTFLGSADYAAARENLGVGATDSVTFDELQVTDEAYSASGWNGNTIVPTQNAVRDQFEAEPAATRTLTNKTVDGNLNTIVPKQVCIPVFAPTVECETGDGASYVIVPAIWNGRTITAVRAVVATAGTTGTMDIQIRRVRSGSAVDVLSTKLTIDSTETSSDTATPAVINTSNDDVNTDDLLFIDVDAIQATPADGLWIYITTGA